MQFDKGTFISNGQLPNGSAEFDSRINKYRSLAYQELPAAPSYPALNSADLLGQKRLRDYQLEAINSWLHGGCRGIICLPTGSGKTQIAVSVIEHLNKRTLIIVPTRILLEQWCNTLKQNTCFEIGQVGDGKFVEGFVTVMTSESAYRHMADLGNRFECLIVDEAHHFGGGLRCEALEMATAPYRLGLTATPPEKEALNLLEKLLGPIMYRLEISDLTGQYLANFEYQTIYLHFNQLGRQKYDQEYHNFKNLLQRFRFVNPKGTWRQLISFAYKDRQGKAGLNSLKKVQKLVGYNEEKKKCLAKLLAQYKQEKILIFTADTDSTFQVAADFFIYPITSEIKKTERSKILRFYSENKINQIVSCRVINEGYDIPEAQIAIIVSGALGTREHIQRIGRVLRPGLNKTAKIYELVMAQSIEVARSEKRRASFV